MSTFANYATNFIIDTTNHEWHSPEPIHPKYIEWSFHYRNQKHKSKNLVCHKTDYEEDDEKLRKKRDQFTPIEPYELLSSDHEFGDGGERLRHSALGFWTKTKLNCDIVTLAYNHYDLKK